MVNSFLFYVSFPVIWSDCHLHQLFSVLGKKDDAVHVIHFLNNEKVLHQWLFPKMEHYCSVLLPFQNSFKANLWLYLSTCLYLKYLYRLIIFRLCRFVAVYEDDNLNISECVQYILTCLL